jgi:hypothetical protein
MAKQTRQTLLFLTGLLLALGGPTGAEGNEGQADLAFPEAWPWPAGADKTENLTPLLISRRDFLTSANPLEPWKTEGPAILNLEERRSAFDSRDDKPFLYQEKRDGFWGSLTSKVSLRELDRNDPWSQRAWQAEEGWQLPMLGPITVFGQLGAGSQEAAMRDMKLAGRTGLAVKVMMAPGAEVQVRGGPGVTYLDPLRPEHVQEKPDWLLELKCRWSLLGGLGLEYQGSAVPALTPREADRIIQDLGLAYPLGQAGKLRFGAKHQWDHFLDARPGAEGMELYLGVQVGR